MDDLVKELRETLRHLDPRMTVTGNLMEEAADRIEELEKAHDVDQRSVHALGEQVTELIVENDALRADLADLVAALPKCCMTDCDLPATTTGESLARAPRMLYCDAASVGVVDLPYAPILRRLAAREKAPK